MLVVVMVVLVVVVMVVVVAAKGVETQQVEGQIRRPNNESFPHPSACALNSIDVVKGRKAFKVYVNKTCTRKNCCRFPLHILLAPLGITGGNVPGCSSAL